MGEGDKSLTLADTNLSSCSLLKLSTLRCSVFKSNVICECYSIEVLRSWIVQVERFFFQIPLSFRQTFYLS